MSDFENEYMEMVEDCMNRESKLSRWEGDFIDSAIYRDNFIIQHGIDTPLNFPPQERVAL